MGLSKCDAGVGNVLIKKILVIIRTTLFKKECRKMVIPTRSTPRLFLPTTVN